MSKWAWLDYRERYVVDLDEIVAVGPSAEYDGMTIHLKGGGAVEAVGCTLSDVVEAMECHGIKLPSGFDD
jgi:hypothetical protein